MSHAQLKHDRFMDLKHELIDDDIISGVMTDEDYAPPHKMAGFLPYDAIIVFNMGSWDESEVEEFLQAKNLRFDTVTGVTDNSDTQLEGTAAAFVSLVEYNP